MFRGLHSSVFVSDRHCLLCIHYQTSHGADTWLHSVQRLASVASEPGHVSGHRPTSLRSPTYQSQVTDLPVSGHRPTSLRSPTYQSQVTDLPVSGHRPTSLRSPTYQSQVTDLPVSGHRPTSLRSPTYQPKLRFKSAQRTGVGRAKTPVRELSVVGERQPLAPKSLRRSTSGPASSTPGTSSAKLLLNLKELFYREFQCGFYNINTFRRQCTWAVSQHVEPF